MYSYIFFHMFLEEYAVSIFRGQNLFQVDAEVIEKGTVLICREVARILANQSC